MDPEVLDICRHFIPDDLPSSATLLEKSPSGTSYTLESKQMYLLEGHHMNPGDTLTSRVDQYKVLSQHLDRKKDVFPIATPVILPGEHRNYCYASRSMIWQMYALACPSVRYLRPPSTEHAKKSGKTLGLLALALTDLSESSFLPLEDDRKHAETLHASFQAALSLDIPGRTDEARDDLHMAHSRYVIMQEFAHILSDGVSNKRLLPASPKFQHILFSPDGNPISLFIPGQVQAIPLILWYGDAVRNLANSAEDDERDSCRVRFNFRHFQAFTEGFLPTVTPVFSGSEKHHLTFAPLYCTYLSGLWHLTDHLSGDVTYPVRYYGENLVRAAVQFTMLKDMEAKLPLMKKIIEDNCHMH